MSDIPRDRSLDSSLALLRIGFPFILNRCGRYQTDIFRMRLLGQKVVCLHGRKGARLFYDETYFH
jgi:fatty-acid peroxygenase